MDDFMMDIMATGSQGDREGRPYKDTYSIHFPRLLVRATLAVALQAD